ncbi:hypothetical protein [Nonomuraea wenchangensis]|uniref:hypothetical protein n=1 Tax=Nonomuraea wenchangensis TaxID=568860 RepID=UPI0033CD7995
MGGGYRVASLTLLAVALLAAAVAGPVVADEARSGVSLAAYPQVAAQPPERLEAGALHAARPADAGVGARKIYVRASAPGNRDGKVPAGGSVPGVRSGKVPVGGSVPGGRVGKVPVGGAVPGTRGHKLPRAGAMPQIRTSKVPDGRSVPGVRAGKVSRNGSVAGVRVGQAPVPHVSIAVRPPGGHLVPKVTVPGMTIYPRAVCEGNVQVGQCSRRGTPPSAPRPPGAPPVVPVRAAVTPTPTPAATPAPSLTPPARVRQAATPPARRKNPLGSVLVMVVLVTTIASTTAVAFGARR